MSWVKNAAKVHGFRFEIVPNIMTVEILPTNIENHELIAPMREKYEREVERIRLSDVTPKQKVHDLEVLRESMTEEVKKVVNEAGFAAALQKIEAISASAFENGVELDWELKENPMGELECAKLIYPTDLFPEDELGITEELK